MREVFYNLTITTISVILALVIGTIELIGVLAYRLDIEDGPLAWIPCLNLDLVGYAIAGLFIVAWAVSIAIWYFGRLDVG